MTLEVRGLQAGYGRAQVLFGVDLSVAAGEMLCVLGRNGVGKTTMLNTVMGVLPTMAGTVTFEGTDVTRLPVHKRVRLGLGYAPQGHETFPQLTVRENMAVTVEGSRRGSAEAAKEALELFPRLVPLLGRPAGLLSGGQQQQLAIARALVTKPSMLILDEPTEGIQPSIVEEILDVVKLLHGRGLAILLVEQYLDFARRLDASVIVMDAGRVAWTGDAAALDDESVRRMVAI